MISFPPISPSSLFGIISVCLSSKDLWFLKLCLGTWTQTFSLAAVIALLGRCLRFAAPRDHSHSLQSSLTSPFFLPLPLFFPCTTHYWTPDMFNRHVLCIIAVAQMVCFSINCNAVIQYCFAKKWKQLCSDIFFFWSSKVFPICVLAGREYLLPTMLALLAHICFGWVWSFPCRPLCLSPSILNTLVLKLGGLLWRIMDVSSCRGSAIRYYHRSYLWAWVARDEWLQSSVSLPINNPLAPRWARCPLTLWSSFPLIYLPLIIYQCLWTFISNSWPELDHWSFFLGLV